MTAPHYDLIIRGGHNIYPARVDELATRHPAVQRAAAVPMKDARLGEKVCLAVVTRAGADSLADSSTKVGGTYLCRCWTGRNRAG